MHVQCCLEAFSGIGGSRLGACYSSPACCQGSSAWNSSAQEQTSWRSSTAWILRSCAGPTKPFMPLACSLVHILLLLSSKEDLDPRMAEYRLPPLSCNGILPLIQNLMPCLRGSSIALVPSECSSAAEGQMQDLQVLRKSRVPGGGFEACVRQASQARSSRIMSSNRKL